MRRVVCRSVDDVQQNKLRKEREKRQQAQANMQILSKTQKSRER